MLLFPIFNGFLDIHNEIHNYQLRGVVSKEHKTEVFYNKLMDTDIKEHQYREVTNYYYGDSWGFLYNING